MVRRSGSDSHSLAIETSEFVFHPSPFTIPFTNRLGQAAVATTILTVLLGASLWHRASLVSPTPSIAVATMAALVIGAFGVAYLVLEKIECRGGPALRRIRFGREGIAVVRKGCLERKRAFSDLALVTADEKEISLLFDDGELVVVPASSFGSPDEFQAACRLAKAPEAALEAPVSRRAA